jgi:dihydroorotate dehydrogenase electron transfer subunit
MIKENCQIIENEKVSQDIYKMNIHCSSIVSIASAGQFLHIKIGEGYDPLLRRPISICSLDKSEGNITLLYRIAGKGTKLLSLKKPKDFLNVIGPLGNGFPIVKNKKCAIIGGGIGIAPLLELSKQIDSPDVYLGFKDEVYIINEFSKYSKEMFVFTEDGSKGVKGYPTQLLSDNIGKYDIVYTCGPKVMMGIVKDLCEEKGIECYLSMEEHMGCGIGACLVCSCNSNVEGVYKKVCVDGPVFNSKEVSLDD